VSGKETSVEVALSEIGSDNGVWRDLMSGEEYHVRENLLRLWLGPYDVVWLKPSA